MPYDFRSVPNTPGWKHPDGRTIFALTYFYAGFSVVVWLDEDGDSAVGHVRHSDPQKRLVTLKPGEQFYVLGKLETLERVEVYREGGPKRAGRSASGAGLHSTP